MGNETAETQAAAQTAELQAAEPAQSAEVQAVETQAADVPAEEQQQPSPWGGFMMPLLLIAIFYFMFLRPQQRKEKERRKTIEQLRAGAKIVFGGGIIGTIAEADERTFLVESEDGTKLRVLRSAVQGTVDGEPAQK